MSIRKPIFTALFVLSGFAATGCASFGLKDAPAGFIEVSSSHYDGEGELRMKAPDNVGINITSESNFRGGSLTLWADDMVRKLSDRGYRLMRQDAVKSRNGIPGTRFDFAYEPPGSTDGERFYTAVLFVTDSWRVIVQVAGKAELEAAHQADLTQIIGKIRIRGCKLGSKVCKSEQPRRFETAQPTRANNEGTAEAEVKAETETETETETEPQSDTKPNSGGADDAPAAEPGESE